MKKTQKVIKKDMAFNFARGISMTGEGTFAMELDHYEKTPPAAQKDLGKAFRPDIP